MHIKIIKRPDRKIAQSILYFQFRFMGWSSEELEEQDDRYGSIPFVYVVGYHNKRIVGVINLHKRKINFNNHKVLLGGIGGVCTHTDYRRKGIASLLLTTGLKFLQKEKCDVAFLCTDIDNLGKLYNKAGFVSLNREYKTTGESGKEYFDNGGMIAPVNSKILFDKILQDKNIFDLQGQDW